MPGPEGVLSRHDRKGALSALPFLRIGRAFARLAAAALIFGPTAILGSATPAAAVAPSVTVSVTGGGNVIAGNDATYSISAHNAGATDGFNLGLYLDVPGGVTFVSSSLGTPVVYTNADYPSIAVGTFRWVWEDVSDLPAGGTFGGSVVVHPTQPAIDNTGTAETAVATVFPVSSTYSVTGRAYLGGTASLLPVFDGSTGVGGATAIAETGAAAPSSAAASMIALRLAKSEPSPEAELPRGVHDQTTVYTLTITETTQGDVDNTVLVDFIPAGLEFLGCGGVDNSTIDWATGDPAVNEYLGAASLTGTPVISAAQCPTPTSVNTVVASASDAATYGVTAGQVYTRVEWNLGTLALGSVTTVRYAAAVPLYENTATWAPAATPTAASLGQAANLDNNTGPSTRHGDPATPVDGDTWTNVANVFGDYQGVVRTAAPRATTARTQETIYAMDLAVQKSITAGGTFNTGAQTTFRLDLQASEYMDASAIVLTDVMGNGLCPLVPTGTPLINPSGLVVTDCTSINGVVTGATVESVTAHPDGTWDMILHPTVATIAANGTHTITYKALNRDEYELAPTEYGPTTSGDGFGNTVSFTAVTDAITVLEPWFPPTWNVWDDSGSSMPTDYTTIDKRVMNRVDVAQGLAPGVDPCTSITATWNPELATGYRFGDTACFELTVNFPSTVDVRNPVVTDFLPAGLTYGGYAIITGPTGSTTPTTLDAAGGRLEWTLGDVAVVGLPDRYVPRGTTFVAHVWATVDGPSTGDGIAPLDKPENLLKYRQQNVDGVLYFLREQASVLVDPEMQLVKGVESVTPNGSVVPDYTRTAATQANANGSVFASDRDGILVREGEQVRYRIDLSTMPYGATGATVWDVLPSGITASAVSAISDGGTAYNPGDGGYPFGLDPLYIGRSIVIWNGVNVPYDVPTNQAHKTLNYTVTVPIGTSVATTHDNDASIIRYSADINTDPPGTSAQDYFPVGSFNTANTANTPGDGTRDGSSIHLPLATIAKAVTSPTDTNNTTTQAVKGEIIHFTYGVTIPAHTSVRNGVLSDALTTPANWTVHDTLTTVDYPGGSTAAGAGSFTIGADTFTVTTTTGRLSFPALYTNTTDSDQVFQVNLYVHVNSTAVAWGHDTLVRRDDTASFASGTQTTINATSGIFVIEPSPTITKAVNDNTVYSGQTVTYTLTAGNLATRPTSFDSQVIDCVRAELAGVTLGTPTHGSASIIPDASCATGTRIVWDIGALVAGAPNQTLTFTATVSPLSAGGATYGNTGALTGWSLDDPLTDRRSYTPSGSVNVVVNPATLTKAVNVATATIGQERTFTVTATIPLNVNFYDTALIDVVPTDMTISGGSFTCVYAGGGSCMGDLPGGGAALTASGTTRGWWLGDIAANAQARTITLTYTGTVRNVAANTTGHTITNTATLRWSATNAIVGPPASANYSPGVTTANRTAVVTVQQPSVTIVKKVNALDSDTVAPGEVFHYTVAVQNPTVTNASTAYAVAISDVIPTNVVVNPATISNGGVLTGANPITGGGTINWTLASLAVGAGSQVTFSYDASLAPSQYLNASARTNNATVTSFTSHPLVTAGFNDSELCTYPVAPATAPTADAVVTPEFPTPVITKTPSAGPAYIGESKTFTIVVTNSGISNALDGQVVDTLPGNWIYDAGSTTVNGIAAANPAIVGQNLTWSALPTLVPTASFTIVYTAHPDASVTWTGANTGEAVNYRNDATVTVNDVSGSPGNLLGTYTASTFAIVHVDKADLLIDKAHNPALDPTAGSSFSWTLTVTNSASSDPAVGPVVVVDTLPADATYVGFSGAGWADDASVPGQVTFTHAGPVPTNGALPIITVNVTIPADVVDATDFTNVATVSAKTFDPDTTNNDDSDWAATVIVADVELVKTSVGGPFTAGETITWTLAATNHGPSVAVAPFTVTDELPANVDWDSVVATGTGWTCDPITFSGDLVCHWSTATLGVGGSTTTLTVSGTVLANVVGTVDNTATVTHTTPDTNLVNNTDDTSDTVLISADVELVKTAVGAPFTAGETIAWDIDLINHGPSVAVAPFTVTDTLPASVDWTSVATSGTGWTCDAVTVGGDLVCHWSTTSLAVGGSAPTLSVTATILPATLGNVSNTATVAHPSPDPVPANNTDGTINAIGTSADLGLTKNSTGGPFTAGDTITWDVDVTNNGPSDSAVPIVVTDTLPANVDWTSVSTGGTGWTCDPVTLAGDLVCSWSDSTLTVGGSAPTLTVSVTILPDVTDTVFNVATVAGPTPDSNPFNDTDDATDPVLISADVELFKTSAGGPFTAGDTITWHLAATNHGPSVAVAPFTVTDTLPSTVNWSTVATSGTGWTCDPVTVGGVLVCTWSTSTLGVGGSTPNLEVTASILPSIVGDIDNTATVTHTTPDPVLVNDTDDSSDTLLTSADLSLTKTTVSVDIPANGTGRFRIEVANAGPSDALNVVVDDALPSGLTFADALANTTSASGDTWTCAGTGLGTLTCTLDSNGGTLPVGGSSWFEFDVQADSTVTAAVLNTATVDSDTPDSDLSNNTDDSTTAPVLTVHKSSSPAVVRRGKHVAYTINVESLSYGATDDVSLVDPIPSSLRVVSISVAPSSDPAVPDWAEPCTVTGQDAEGYGGTVTCILDGFLERGRTTPDITIIAMVKPSTTPGTIVNIAEVRWTDPEDLVAGVFSEDDDAPIGVTLTELELAASGAMGLPYELTAAVIALVLGIGLVVVARRRRGLDEAE